MKGLNESKCVSQAQIQCQGQDPIFRRSEHIDAYTPRSFKRHFEHNGGGPESKFDRLRECHISVSITNVLNDDIFI